MRLISHLTESFTAADDPDSFEAAMAVLRSADIWQHVRPSILLAGPNVELRVTITSVGDHVVGASHNHWLTRTTIRRSVVIMPEFQRSEASFELSLIELEDFFERGCERVIYHASPAATAAHKRIERLGGVFVRPIVGQLLEWVLTPEGFRAAVHEPVEEIERGVPVASD